MNAPGRHGEPPAQRVAPTRETFRLIPALAQLTDARLALLLALGLFVLAAWPLLLVDLPPFQDLPNHVATAHIIAHPELYPQYTFNGFFKSNALLTLWLHLLGGHGLFGAARAFTALVLAVNALALPLFVLRFAGRRALLVAPLFVWPLVHGFFLSMGMMNFAFAVPFSLLMLTVIDQQRERPTVARGCGIGALSIVLWYAHPFPLAIAGGLVGLHAITRPTWRARFTAGLTLLAPLAPAVMLSLLAAERHLVKASHTSALPTAFAYQNPLELLGHFWLDASGALTRAGSMTLVPAVLLLTFAWKQHRQERRQERGDGGRAHIPFFSTLALAVLAGLYLALPVMLSNWWYFNCRLIPFLWAGLALRLPDSLPRPVAGLLVACALAFSAVLGLDYARLERDRAEFTAGMDAVPARATLLPLLFKHQKTSRYTASLTHAWGYYTVLKDASAPLVFAIERSYPITYREFPPRALIPPALDQFAERNGTPAQVCGGLHLPVGDPACLAAWRQRWSGFWTQAEPRFSHVLTWAITPEARAELPADYHRVFAGGDLEIYARGGPAADVSR